jgi:hypothetical protein
MENLGHMKNLYTSKTVFSLFFLFLFLVSTRVLGQTEQQVLPSELKEQTVITEPVTLRKGFFRAAFFGSYTFIDQIFDNNGERGYVLGSNGWARVWSYQLTLSYGITDRLQVLVWPEFVNKKFFYSDEYHMGSSTESAYADQKAIGFGDLGVGVDYQILTESERRPSFVAKLSLTLPTGQKNPTEIKDWRDFKVPTGSGEFVLTLDLNIRKIFYPYSFTFYTGYAYHFEGEKVFYPDYPEDEEIRFKSGDRFNVGGSFNFHLNDWIALQNQVFFFSWGPNKIFTEPTAEGENAWVLSYQPVLNFQIRRFRLFEIISIPVLGKNYGADPFYVLGLLYTF